MQTTPIMGMRMSITAPFTRGPMSRTPALASGWGQYTLLGVKEA